jgi:hypothetical protein
MQHFYYQLLNNYDFNYADTGLYKEDLQELNVLKWKSIPFELKKKTNSFNGKNITVDEKVDNAVKLL